MQPEAMTVLLGCETMGEYADQILGGNAYAIVRQANCNSVLVNTHYANHDLSLRIARRFDGIFRIADEVQQDLQHFVAVCHYRRKCVTIDLQNDSMTLDTRPRNPQHVLHQLAEYDLL